MVDQFEELFTLSPKETQAALRGAARPARRRGRRPRRPVAARRLPDPLLGARAARARLRVELTPLPALTPGRPAARARRAGEEARLPLRGRGARRRDGVESVEGARGALPLLAFAVSRLWERRDRERKLLTRAAYEEIGGVAGALAQHAEATMDRIGAERQAVVREIFRNLVTAQGTRAVVDREELLSAFPERAGRRGGAAPADRRAAADELRGGGRRRASRATTGSRWCTSRC